MKKRSLQLSIIVVLISILLLTSSSNPDPNAMPSDKDGRELWKQEFEDYSGDLLRYLYITEKEEILAVGQWLSNNGKQTSNEAAET